MTRHLQAICFFTLSALLHADAHKKKKGELLFSDADAKRALRGLERGIEQDQPKDKRKACLDVLDSLSGPLINFMKVVGSGCSENVVTCVPAICQGIKKLGNSSTSHRLSIQRQCPKQFDVILTALRDPFLVMNMATLAVLHAASVTEKITKMLQELSHERYEDFGFFLGRVLNSILPLVRLPLTDAQMNLVVEGFVQSFSTSKHREHVRRSQGNATSYHLLSGRATPSQACTADTEQQLAPANKALELIASSMLNITCYGEIGHLQMNCLKRAFQGIASFASMLYGMVNGRRDLTKSDCPPKLVTALRRLDNKPHLALDLITNSIEDFGLLEARVYGAMDYFYDNKLFLFGSQLGILYDQATSPAFYQYRSIEIQFVDLPIWKRVLMVMLLPPSLLMLSALPLMCIFCSSFSGWPPQHQEISLEPDHSSPAGSQFSMSYEFFGGRVPVGSDIEFMVQPANQMHMMSPGGDLPHQSDAPLSYRGLGSTGIGSTSLRHQSDGQLPDPSMGSTSSLTGPERTRSHSDLQMRKSASNRFSSNSHSNVGSRSNMRASTRIVQRSSAKISLTLTDELEPMGLARYAFWSVIGYFLPCFAGGPRRWKAHHFWKVGGIDRLSGIEDEWNSEDFEGTEAELSTAMRMTYSGPGDACDTEFYVGHQIVEPPVPDLSKETGFSVKNVASAVLRIKPANIATECMDQLLFFSAFVQLVASIWRLFFFVFFGGFLMILNGESCTLLFLWCRLSAAVVAIHKKMHARWFGTLHDLTRMNRDNLCGCGCTRTRVLRTPTPVPLFVRAPALKTTKEPLFRYAYEARYPVEEQDTVKVIKWFHPKKGMTGTVVACNPSDAAGKCTVSFNDALEDFFVDDLELADDGRKQSLVPVWHDRLTEWIRKIFFGLWFAFAVSLVLLSEQMCDKDGFLVLRLQAPEHREPLSDWVLGIVVLVQLSCIFFEVFLRSIAWLLIACAAAFCYAS